MGVNDAREQLEVAKAECVRLEALVESIREARRAERVVLVAAINREKQVGRDENVVLREVIRQVRSAFEMQCPPDRSAFSGATGHGAFLAHSWWYNVLGPILKAVDHV